MQLYNAYARASIIFLRVDDENKKTEKKRVNPVRCGRVNKNVVNRLKTNRRACARGFFPFDQLKRLKFDCTSTMMIMTSFSVVGTGPGHSWPFTAE